MMTTITPIILTVLVVGMLEAFAAPIWAFAIGGVLCGHWAYQAYAEKH